MRYKGINNLCFVVVKNLNLVSLLSRKAIGLALILLFTLLPLLNVEAAPNYQINYQGKLHDSAGDAVTDGDYDIVFSLYTASSGGVAIWTESHTGANDVAITDGLFSVMLGSITSLSTVNFNQTLYLGVTVEADSEMTPRKILGTVPSAFEADKLDGLTSADFISTSTTALPNVWSASGLGSVGSSTATTTFLGNLAAAGSSIFNGILTVFDRVTSPYFVATSTSVASQFPYASTTMISATTASTTNLIISGLGSGLTKVTNGVVSLATAGTDYLTSAFQNWQISGGYLTPTTTQTVLLNGGFVSSASSTVSGLLKTDYASTTALTVTGSGHSFNITNSNATSTIVGDVNIAGSTGVTIWTNDGNSNVAQGSLNIGSATPQNGFAVTRLGGSDTTFARFTEAGGALAQFVDGTGIQLDFRDAGVISRIRFDSNGDNYISPASGNVYFSPAAGNVGIGTSTPQADLNIGNNIAIESASAGSSVPARSTLGGALLGIGLLDTGPYIQSFASQPLLLNPGGNNVGIGTTTPGTLFSLGNTGASTINITPSGTSTFGLGLNLRGGCYAINGTCIGGGSASLSGGTAGMLAAWTSSSALTATGTPNFDAFNATSTTATSTIAGGLAIETSGLVYDYSTNRVGIGTASPGVPLEVVGNIRTTGDGIGLIVADTSLNYSSNLVYSSSLLGLSNISRIRLGGNTGTSAFAISNFDAAINFIVNRTGNVGVGTTSPYARLSVAGETVAERFTATSTSQASVFPYASTTAITVSGAGNLNIDTTNTSPFTISSTLPRIILTDSTAGDDDFTISPNSDYIEFLSGSLRDILVINGETRTSGAGFIGIGTTTPSAQLAASTTAGIGLMVDQRGTDDILRLLDGGSTVLEVPDGGNLYLANGDFLGWRNASGAVRTIMSHDSSNNVNIKTSDSTVLRFLSSTGVFELARINQSNYASFGIGTTTPGAMLSASSSAGAIGLMIDQQGTGDIARFLDAGSPALIIRDGGNVGIGTTSPDYLLTIGNTASAANNKIAIDAAAARQSSISFRSAGVDKWFIGRGDSDVLSDSSFFIGNTSGGTNNDAGGASAKLTINSSGLVGIGTSTSATTEGLLHVADNSTGAVNAVLSNTNSGTGAFASWQVRNGGSLAEGIRLGVTGTGFTTSGGFIQDGGFLSSGTNIAGGLSLITQGSAPIRFYTNGHTNERMQITSGGLVGIGTTTPGTLFSLGDTGASTINITPTGTSTFGLGLNLRGGCYAINNTCIGGSGSGSGTVNSGTADYVAYYPSSGTAVSTASGIKTYQFSSSYRGTAVGDPTYALAGSTLVPQGIFEVGYFATSTFPTYAGWHDALSINGYSNSGDSNSRWVDFVAGGANSGGFGHSTMRFYTRGNESNPSLALTIEPDKDVVIVGDLTVSGDNLNTTVSSSGLTLNSNLTINGGRINNSTTTIISSGIDDGSGNDGGTVIIAKGGTGEDPDEGNGGTVNIASGGIGVASGDSGGDGGTIILVAGGLEGGGAGTDGNDGTVTIGNSAGAKKNATLNVYGTANVMFRNTATTNGVCHSGTDVDATDTTNIYSLVACSAAPGDIAEMYSTLDEVEAGDIVGFSDETITYESHGSDPYTGQVSSQGMVTINKLKKAESGEGVVGIISTAPYQTFGKDVLSADPEAKPLALAGRVPVKVNMEGGEIKAGDKITLSSVAGVGKKFTGTGVTVGLALHNYDGPGEGEVMVLVNLSHAKLDSAIVGGDLATSTMWTMNSSGHLRPFATLDINNMDIINVRSIMSASGNWSISEDGTLTAKKIQTDELCVGVICVGEDRLRELLENAGIDIDESGGDVEGGGDNNGGDDNATTTPPTDEPGDDNASSTPPVEETPEPETPPGDEVPTDNGGAEPTPEPEPELESLSGDEIPTDNGGTPAEEPPAEAPPAE